MTYYQLPAINYNMTQKNIKIKFTDKENIDIYINDSLNKYLKIAKGKISEYPEEWRQKKKFTNPYEFIHTNIPSTCMSISKVSPLSRAFFKMIEITKIFNIFEGLSELTSFHLAEGPGGFIEAFVYLRHNPQDKYYGMTLIDNQNKSIPGWKKSELFLKKNNNVKIEYCEDGKGDLYNFENLAYCQKKYKNSIDIITGDGGFDFSVDYDKQESMALKLIFSQIAYAITMQKKGGTFILKVFDLFLKPSVQLIYLLSCCYEQVYIIKPYTSRAANSEKYIICKEFKLECSLELSNKFISVLKVLRTIENKIVSILDIPIQYYYLNHLVEINAIFGQQQMENIMTTILYIENENKSDQLKFLKNKNIQRCLHWCKKYEIPYNKNIYSTNVFLNEINSQ